MPDGSIQQTSNTLAFTNIILDINKFIEVSKTNFDSNPGLIGLTPRLFINYGLPYAFDPKAGGPLFLKYLQEIQPDPEIRRQIKLLFGLSLIPETRFNVFFVLFGEPGTGKSVLLIILRELIGGNNVSSVPFHQFSEKHSIGLLTRNLLNLVADADTENPKDANLGQIEGVLKLITDGGDVTVEDKFKPPYRAPVTARLIMACNNLPPFLDRTMGIWDRLRVIPFGVRFRGTSSEDPSLRDRIVATELPGIFNWALEGLLELLALQRFPETAAGLAIKNEHRMNCDHEFDFLNDNFEPATEPPNMVSSEDLYVQYRDWCAKNGYYPFGAARFAKSVQRIFPAAIKTRISGVSPGSKPTVWKGLRRRDFRG